MRLAIHVGWVKTQLFVSYRNARSLGPVPAYGAKGTKLSISVELSKICDCQGEEGFILTGFYLELDDLAGILDSLTVDDPDVGAVGRYLGVPVFPKEKTPDEEGIALTKMKWATKASIVYTFVQMGVYDCGDRVE